MAQASIQLILDNRRSLKDGTYPVKIRVTYERKSKYFPTKYSLSEVDFEKAISPKPRKEFKDLNMEFSKLKQVAIDAADDIPFFTFEAFEKKLLNTTVKDDVFAAFEKAVERLMANEQIGTAKTYESARTSLLSFVNREKQTRNKGLSLVEAKVKRQKLTEKMKPLPFGSVNPDFLKEYEKWVLKSGKSLTTVGIYLRNLRALFNEAIATGGLHPEFYPFGKRKYQIPSSKGVKKALSKDDIKKIFEYVPRHESEAKSRDLWCFSYLCNGINLKDIARLKYNQVEKDVIVFVRAKTERTTRHEQKSIRVTLLPQAAQIIERWGNKPALGKSYVFPILKEGLTPEKELATVKQAIKVINGYLKHIAEELGIEMKVTTYSARHSYATILKRAGASTAFISDALGHSSEKTTQSYLGSFDDETMRHMAASLIDF